MWVDWRRCTNEIVNHVVAVSVTVKSVRRYFPPLIHVVLSAGRARREGINCFVEHFLKSFCLLIRARNDFVPTGGAPIPRISVIVWGNFLILALLCGVIGVESKHTPALSISVWWVNLNEGVPPVSYDAVVRAKLTTVLGIALLV